MYQWLYNQSFAERNDNQDEEDDASADDAKTSHKSPYVWLKNICQCKG